MRIDWGRTLFIYHRANPLLVHSEGGQERWAYSEGWRERLKLSSLHSPLPYFFRPRKTKYYFVSWPSVPLKWDIRKFWCKRRAQLYRLLYNCRSHLFLTASHLFLEEACDLFLIFSTHIFLAEAASYLGLGLQKRSYSTIYICKVYVKLPRQLFLLRKDEGKLNKTKSCVRKRTVPFNNTTLQL